MSWSNRNGDRLDTVVDELGIREHLEEVPIRRVEDVELAIEARSIISSAVRPARSPTAKPYCSPSDTTTRE